MYIDAEIATNIPVNIPNGQIKKIAFLAGAAYAVRRGVRQYISHPVLLQLGAVDEAGNMDLDGVLEAARGVIPEEGFKVAVPILGDLTFFAEDVEKLAEYIREV